MKLTAIFALLLLYEIPAADDRTPLTVESHASSQPQQHFDEDLSRIAPSRRDSSAEVRFELDATDTVQKDIDHRFGKFQSGEMEFMDLDPIKRTSVDSASLDEDQLSSSDQLLDQPRPFFTISPKLMQFYVEDNWRMITAFYVKITAYAGRFERRTYDEVMPFDQLYIKTDSSKPLHVYVQRSGVWTKKKMLPNRIYRSKCNQRGEFYFAIPSDREIGQSPFIRFRSRSMPENLWQIVSTNLRPLFKISKMTPADLMQERDDVRLLKADADVSTVDHTLKAIREFIGPTMFSEAVGAMHASTNMNIRGPNARMDITGYNERLSAQNEPELVEVNFKKRRRNYFRGGRKNPARAEDYQESQGNEKSRLQKRDFFGAILDSCAPHYSNEQDSLFHLDLLQQHERTIQKHFHPSYHSFWELSNENGSLRFHGHDETSFNQRLAALSSSDADATSILTSDQESHRLVKRQLQAPKMVDFDELKFDDASSIMVVREKNSLVVQLVQASKQILSAVVEFTRQAWGGIIQLFQMMGVILKNTAQWFRSLFTWSSVLAAAKIGTTHLENMIPFSLQVLSKYRNWLGGSLQQLKQDVIGSLETYADRLDSRGTLLNVKNQLEGPFDDDQNYNDPQATFLQVFSSIRTKYSSCALLLHSLHFQDQFASSFSSGGFKSSCNTMSPFTRKEQTNALNLFMEYFKSRAMQKIQLSDASNSLKIVDWSKFGSNMLGDAAGHFIRASLIPLISGFFDFATDAVGLGLQAVLSLLSHIGDLMSCRIEVPGLTEFYENIITRGTQTLTLASLISISGSLMFVTMYKMHNGGKEPFDSHDANALMLSPTPNAMMSSWVQCKKCRSVDELSVERRVNLLSWLMGYMRAVTSTILSVVDLVLKATMSLIHTEPVFHGISHLLSFPFESPRITVNETLPGPISMEAWAFGCIPLVFASTETRSMASAAEVLQMDMMMRLPHVGLKLFDFERMLLREKQEFSLMSTRSWWMSTRAFSDILQSFPPITIQGINPRMISTVLDVLRLEVAMVNDWQL